MSIQNKDWHARLDNMPGLEGQKFTVSGTVTLPSSTAEATLVMSPKQDKSPNLRLILNIEDNGIGLSVLTDRSVSYEHKAGHLPENTRVIIFYKEQELVRINDLEIVN